MQVKGKHEFKIPRERLWTYLMDVEVLAKITPGISKLEALGNDHFKTHSVIKLGPVKSTFTGKMQVVNKEEPASFIIKMEQLSKIGNAHVTVQMLLSETTEGNSSLEFEGKANLSGVIARTGQRVLSGVANAITKEVFTGLDKHIEEDKKVDTQSENIIS